MTTYERNRGKVLNSQILLADAAHTTSDIYVSVSVLISLAVTSLGYPWIDVVAALLIVAVIARAGLGIIGNTSNTLADHQTLDPDAIADLLANVPGIEGTSRIRSRGPADAVHVDIDTRVKPAVTTDHAFAISETIQERIKDAFPEVEEVQVHFEPQRNATVDYALEARAVADSMGLSIHEVVVIPVPNLSLIHI